MNESTLHRELSKRQHRILALELLFQAWIHQVDALLVNRVDIERFLKLERFKKERVKWLQEDTKSIFPYQVLLTSGSEQLGEIVFSRVSLGKLPSGEMHGLTRVEYARRQGLRIEHLMDLESFDSNETEEQRFAFLSLLSAGLTELPKVEKDFEQRHADELEESA